jgi:hypothetical protein
MARYNYRRNNRYSSIPGSRIDFRWYDRTLGDNEWRNTWGKGILIAAMFVIDPVNTLIAIDSYINYNDAPGGNVFGKLLYSVVMTFFQAVAVACLLVGIAAFLTGNEHIALLAATLSVINMFATFSFVYCYNKCIGKSNSTAWDRGEEEGRNNGPGGGFWKYGKKVLG